VVKASGRKAAQRAPGEKRPPAELAKLTERLGEYIKSNPGRRMEAIGKAIGMPTRELNLPIKKLLAAKKIRSEGHKRATEYFPT
jgi:predicted transcriptional regulator